MDVSGNTIEISSEATVWLPVLLELLEGSGEHKKCELICISIFINLLTFKSRAGAELQALKDYVSQAKIVETLITLLWQALESSLQ